MSKVVLQIIVVLVIICVGGFFAASEMALVSLREGQVRALSKRGRRGQKAARLAQDPNRFFSAVQIGVTLATLVSGAYGAETLAAALKTWLIRQHLSPGWAGPVSFLAVTIVITFFSLILGELAPKRIGLQRAPALALLAGPLLDRIATLARPVVWLLTKSTNLVVAILGGDPRIGRQAMTEQEVRELVASTQTISQDERKIVSEVFDAGQAADPRGPGAAHRGGLPGRRDPGRGGGRHRGRRAALPAAGLPGHLRQRDRLRARPGPARPRRRQERGAGRPDQPPGQVPADQQDGAVLAVRDAPRAGAPGRGDRRLRRHGRHRHARGPGRGADRRHQGRVRHRAGPGDEAPGRRRRGRRPAQPERVHRADRHRAARGPVRDGRGLRPGRPGRPAVGGRQRAGGGPHHHRDRARRPPHRPPPRHREHASARSARRFPLVSSG